MTTRQNLKTLPGKPYPMGISYDSDGTVNFAVSLHSREECGVLLYLNGRGAPIRLPFRTGRRIGNIYCLRVDGLQESDFRYNFYAGDEIITDPYACLIHGNEKWGKKVSPPLKGGVDREDYDWEEDVPLMTPLSDTILYLIHPRGFTRHASSGVRWKGTFVGITEKISHMKELGITAVELMPSYEFMELEKPPQPENTMETARAHYMDPPEDGGRPRINYWGYKRGFYFAPKMSLSATGDPCREFRDMVKTLHRAGIEVIMQFYFPTEVKQAYMLEVVRHWVLAYHVDGFHLMGTHVPMAFLATEPTLGNVKMFYQDMPCREIYDRGETPMYRNLAAYNDGFMYDMRHFLKSDEGSLGPALESLRYHPGQIGTVDYITNYCGFTLADLVSYDRKHNEDNGEDGQDGETYNVSWNCGCEGRTRRKGILELRRKQMKNAMLLLLTAQGTPMIVSGDEFCSSRDGNNNPYCQDNPVNWLNWGLKEKNGRFYDFVRQAVLFRKQHASLHREEGLTMQDHLACGYPDISYHGEEAWRLHADRLSRHAGVMYYDHARKGKEEGGSFLYIAYNMHWEAHDFALPDLPEGMQWQEVCNTAADGSGWADRLPVRKEATKETGEGQTHIHKRYHVKARSVCILEGISAGSGKKKSSRRAGRKAGRKAE